MLTRNLNIYIFTIYIYIHILSYFLVKYDSKKQTPLLVRGLITLFHCHRAASPGRVPGCSDTDRSNPFATKGISCLGPIETF